MKAITRQTIMPNRITVVHACENRAEQQILDRVIQQAVAGTPRNLHPRPSLVARAHLCKSQFLALIDFDACVLDAINSDDQDQLYSYTVLLTNRDIFEPAALEKCCLYLSLNPTITAVKGLSYDESTVRHSQTQRHPLLIKQKVPSANHTITEPFFPTPLLYRTKSLNPQKQIAIDTTRSQSERQWRNFVNMLSHGRLLREALYTYVYPHVGADDIRYSSVLLSPRHAPISSREIPPHIRTAVAFYKWSARQDEDEMFSSAFETSSRNEIDLRQVQLAPSVNVAPGKRVMFVMPTMQMGGSEKAMLDLAERILKMNWVITFVLTMPDWHQDSLGEIGPQHAWLDRALALTSDVFDISILGSNEKRSRTFRYLLESRKPDFVLISNARWAYGHSALIRAALPNAVIADYNHMIHTSWFGGGLPRYGANNSRYFDVHFTASKDVATPMEKWIDSKLLVQNPEKVRPCYIGTDPSLYLTGSEKASVRLRLKQKLGISESAIVILFAGRFIVDKGTDVLLETVKNVTDDKTLASKFEFVFVGDGTERPVLENAAKKYHNMHVVQPARNLLQMRDYYAMSDVLLLPSVNEGIALVLYEAMAAGLLVITTDVGGQRELVSRDVGVLLQDTRFVSILRDEVLATLREMVSNPQKFDAIREHGSDKVRSQFTTRRFCDCVMRGLQEAAAKRTHVSEATSSETFAQLSKELVPAVQEERFDGIWKRRRVTRSVEHAITIGIKTYVCDEQTIAQVRGLLRSIRVNYPRVRVLLGNDGPLGLREEDFVKNDAYTEELQLPADSGISMGRNALVNETTTKYFVLLDDDHLFDDTTNLVRIVRAMERGKFEMVGMRVRNLPGIDELERLGINIPRYVSKIEGLKDRVLTLCTWNENEGPSVYEMDEAIEVDVLHNAFMGKTDTLRRHGWDDELQVNEHMTFFLDNWRAGVRVGYLPSEFVHHRAREYSKCYYQTRFREERFRKLLDYEDRFQYNIVCGRRFPGRVSEHMTGKGFRT